MISGTAKRMARLLALSRVSPSRYLEVSLFVGGVVTAVILVVGVLLGLGYNIPGIDEALDLFTLGALLLVAWSIYLQFAIPKLKTQKKSQELSDKINYQYIRLQRIKHTFEYFSEEIETPELYEKEASRVQESREETAWKISNAEAVFNNYYNYNESITEPAEVSRDISIEEEEELLERLKRRIDLANEALEDYMSVVKYHIK